MGPGESGNVRVGRLCPPCICRGDFPVNEDEYSERLPEPVSNPDTPAGNYYKDCNRSNYFGLIAAEGQGFGAKSKQQDFLLTYYESDPVSCNIRDPQDCLERLLNVDKGYGMELR